MTKSYLAIRQKLTNSGQSMVISASSDWNAARHRCRELSEQSKLIFHNIRILAVHIKKLVSTPPYTILAGIYAPSLTNK